MSRALCPHCAGSGEGTYLYPIPFSTECRELSEPCRGCRGSGFEPRPTFQTKKEAIERFQRAMAAMDLAVNAFEEAS